MKHITAHIYQESRKGELYTVRAKVEDASEESNTAEAVWTELAAISRVAAMYTDADGGGLWLFTLYDWAELIDVCEAFIRQYGTISWEVKVA